MTFIFGLILLQFNFRTLYLCKFRAVCVSCTLSFFSDQFKIKESLSLRRSVKAHITKNLN
jgi:hypothetical protein